MHQPQRQPDRHQEVRPVVRAPVDVQAAEAGREQANQEAGSGGGRAKWRESSLVAAHRVRVRAEEKAERSLQEKGRNFQAVKTRKLNVRRGFKARFNNCLFG